MYILHNCTNGVEIQFATFKDAVGCMRRKIELDVEYRLPSRYYIQNAETGELVAEHSSDNLAFFDPDELCRDLLANFAELTKHLKGELSDVDPQYLLDSLEENRSLARLLKTLLS